MDRQTLLMVLDLVDQCTKTNSNVSEVKLILAQLNNIIPFTSSVIMIESTPDCVFKSKKQAIADDCVSAFHDIYLHEGLNSVDPRKSAHLNTSNVISWKETFGSAPNLDPSLKKLLKEYNRLEGASVRVKSPEGASVIGFAMTEGYDNSVHQEVLGYMAPHIHHIFNRPGDHNRKTLFQPSLSQRERDVLNWAKEGKSNNQISNILNISERTVKYHFSNVFLKLKAVNRAQAIAKGIHHGIIHI